MQGFFYTEEKKRKTRNRKNISSKKRTTNSRSYDCEYCGLYQNCKSPKMKPTGLGDLKILIVAEAPGKTEDEFNIQLVGESGQLLRKILDDIGGYCLDKDFIKTNAVICRPPKNRTPTKKEIKCCRSNLFKLIEEEKPEKIIALGTVAFEALTGKTGLEKWVGEAIPHNETGAIIYPTYHPSYLIRNSKDIILEKKFREHIANAINDKRPYVKYDLEKYVTIINNSYAATTFLQGIMDGSTISIDIETTGKKPHAPGHKIACIAIATARNQVSVFPYFEDKEFIKELKRVLRNKTIKKVAHNLKFENIWFKVIMKATINNWYWDTMIGAHVLDNRNGITGLKHQLYVKYGIEDYDKNIAPFLKSKEKGGNSFNIVFECNQNELMTYCAMDALGTWLLCADQQKQMNCNDLLAYNFFHDILLELCVVEQNGIAVDVKWYEKQVQFLTKRMNTLDKEIMQSEHVALWDGKEKFKYTSNKDFPHLLFDILKLEPPKLTAKGNASVDEESLQQIDLPFIKDILKWRKLKKLRDTYIVGFLREAVDGIMYPSFNLNTVITYRSSSSNPNFQNVPKHEKKAIKLVRKGIKPRPGHQLAELDYSGIEVCLSACYHKDPQMIKYIKDKTTDMHRDQAMEIYIMSHKEVTKDLRYLSKNNFVFPQFYGSWWKECAENLWQKTDEKTKKHLKENGVKSLGKIIKVGSKIKSCTGFYKHIQKVENKFWNEKFKVYNKWKKSTWEKYQKTGVMLTKTNFSLRARMQRNDALNYPIQGTAFHCLAWSLVRVNRFLTKEKYNTKLIGQIHDSLVLDLDPAEKKEILPIIKRIMTKDIRKEFPWIIVPLEIEMEISEIDGSWYEMHEEEIAA